MNSNDNSELESPSSDGRLPSLAALRCFEAAARLENFTRAADALSVTHGAVSRAVRTLEDDLGLALFERRSQRVFLTDAGRRLARAVRDGMGLMQDAVSELRASTRQAQPWVLSCEPTLLMRWLIPRWGDFQARYPDVNVHLVAGGGPFSFGRGIDLAIRRDDFAWSLNTHAEFLFAEKVAPVCRPDKVQDWFATTAQGMQLREHAPRLHTRTRVNAWDVWSQAAGVTLPPAAAQSFEHFYFSLQAAVAGLGVAIGPWHLVRDDIETGVLVAPTGFVEDGSNYCLLSPTPLADGSPQRHLLNWIREMA